MGSHCSKLENQYEDKVELKNDIPQPPAPIFTAKLDLHAKIDKGVYQMRPNEINDSVLEITTERNMQESVPQQFNQIDQRSQLLSRKYYDDTMTINKSQFLVYSQNVDVLQDLCLQEVQSQRQKKMKKEEEEEPDFDAMCKQDWDQVKFQTPAVMNLVDKQQALQSSIQLKAKQAQRQQFA